jgi:hypothetical protein
MLRGPLADTGYKPQFSGHGTFPLRYGWLKKTFDAVQENDNQEGNISIFTNQDAIARFGVGKNMVESMRHWAVATDILESGTDKNSLKTTQFGQLLLNDNGWDPYLEHPSSLWLIHWKLCGSIKKVSGGVKDGNGKTGKTTWFWVFSHHPSPTFERETIVKALCKTSEEFGWRNVSPNTVKRDVECFVRSYATRPIRSKEAHEDALECPLVELGLIKSTGTRDGFRIVRGKKGSLTNSVFLYALLEFWQGHSESTFISLETLMHEPGSPGRVFMLDEDDVSDRLMQIEELTNGEIQWSETAGLKALEWKRENTKIDPLSIISSEFADFQKDKVA